MYSVRWGLLKVLRRLERQLQSFRRSRGGEAEGGTRREASSPGEAPRSPERCKVLLSRPVWRICTSDDAVLLRFSFSSRFEFYLMTLVFWVMVAPAVVVAVVVADDDGNDGDDGDVFPRSPGGSRASAVNEPCIADSWTS